MRRLLVDLRGSPVLLLLLQLLRRNAHLLRIGLRRHHLLLGRGTVRLSSQHVRAQQWIAVTGGGGVQCRAESVRAWHEADRVRDERAM